MLYSIVSIVWSNAELVCTCDTRIVDPDVVAQVARTHPELVVNGGTQPSPSYLDPVSVVVICSGPGW